MVAALDGIRVLDVSGLGPATMAATMLGDMGADVIKVEIIAGSGGVGDGISYIPPGEEGERMLCSNSVNRNKRSIGLALRTAEGQQIFHRLAETADVVIEGFRPGAMDRMNLGYGTLSKVNPGIVYCAVTGFGQTGPYSHLAGHDGVFIAMGGIQSLIGESEDTPPVIPQNVIGDLTIGYLEATVGIMGALMAREKTGRGQMVDISMMDGVITLLPAITGAHSFFYDGKVPKRGSMLASGTRPYYALYQTKDNKYLALTPVEPKFWRNMCKAMGREDLIPLQYDADKQGELFAEMKRIFLTRTRKEWFELLSEADTGIGKVLTIDELPDDPHVQERGMILEIDHPRFGKVRQFGFGIKFSDTPCKVRCLPGQPGIDTEEILLETGYAKADIDQMRQNGTI
ncbi:MAG: CoA transferase [Dehalococcoidia bacterium]